MGSASFKERRPSELSQDIIDIGFEHIGLGSVDRLDSPVLLDKSKGALCLPCSQVSHFLRILHCHAEPGHAGVHQDDIFPSSQESDDSLRLASGR